MKKYIMSFLMAGLVIISALCLSSCKKTDTVNTNMECIPTVYDVITVEDAQNLTGDRDWNGEYIDCYYCPGGHLMPGASAYEGGLLYRCDDDIHFDEETHTFYCPEHSHEHFFTVEEDCTPPGQAVPYFCIYNHLREHRHILTYTSYFFFNGWHVGGGAASE